MTHRRQKSPGSFQDELGGVIERIAPTKVPVLITSVSGAERTPALIRSGASDVCLASVGDDVIAQKLWRLIRRKR